MYTFCVSVLLLSFFFNDTATTEIYTLSLHDALPISQPHLRCDRLRHAHAHDRQRDRRSEEHTSEFQSPCNLVCRLLLEKKLIEVTGSEEHKPKLHARKYTAGRSRV